MLIGINSRGYIKGTHAYLWMILEHLKRRAILITTNKFEMMDMNQNDAERNPKNRY